MERTEIDAIRQIPLADFLARLGHEPVRRSGNELWYRAPYRSERTPSFRVNVAKQLWYDFGLGKGGDIFTLAGEFAQSVDFMEQARFIATAANMVVDRSAFPTYQPKPAEPAFEGVEAVPLLRSPLTDYLAERGIPYAVASHHCFRLNYGVRGKRYFAIGFPNMAGGYEVRSRHFKGCIPPKDVSLVKLEKYRCRRVQRVRGIYGFPFRCHTRHSRQWRQSCAELRFQRGKGDEASGRLRTHQLFP